MSSYQMLLSRVKLVRRRWRTQMLFKGVSLFLACSIAMLVLGIWPRTQGDYGILSWEGLLAARRKVRHVLRQWCTNL